MSTAVEDDLFRQNPVRIKGAPAEQMIERPLLTWDDVRSLAGAIHPRFECLVWTAVASGLRFGELAGLSVDHVDLDRSSYACPSAQRHQGRRSDTRPAEDESCGADGRYPRGDHLATRRSHRSVRRRRAVRLAGVHVAARRPASQHLLRSLSVEGPIRGRAPTCALPRSPPPRWNRSRDRRRVPLREVMAMMGHASSAVSLRYLKASESRGTRSPTPSGDGWAA